MEFNIMECPSPYPPELPIFYQLLIVFTRCHIRKGAYGVRICSSIPARRDGSKQGQGSRPRAYPSQLPPGICSNGQETRSMGSELTLGKSQKASRHLVHRQEYGLPHILTGTRPEKCLQRHHENVPPEPDTHLHACTHSTEAPGLIQR